MGLRMHQQGGDGYGGSWVGRKGEVGIEEGRRKWRGCAQAGGGYE